MFTLKSISKRNKSFVYHIEVKASDETFYVEMRKQKLTTNVIYFALILLFIQLFLDTSSISS